MPLPAWLAAVIPPAVNALGNLFGSGLNRRAQDRQYSNDMKMLKYQNEYNTPLNQRKRYESAGLNPNLMYGQGTVGNMESAPRYPQQAAPDYQAALSGLGTQIAQMQLMKSQTNLTNQKVAESGVKQDLMKSQKSLVDANPYLNKSYVDAMVLNLKSTAELKEQESSFMLSKTSVDGVRWERGYLKMQRELDLIAQRFNLGSADQKIKAKILESKGFQNALQGIQLKWMRDQEITPQHIYQGIMLLLQKMM